MTRIGGATFAVLAVLAIESARADVTIKIDPNPWFGDDKCKVSLGLDSAAPANEAVISLLTSGGDGALCSVWSLPGGTQWKCSPDPIEAACTTITEATVESVTCGDGNGAPTPCGAVTVAAPEIVTTHIAPDSGQHAGVTVWVAAGKDKLLFDKPFGCELAVERALPAPDRNSVVAFDLAVFAKGGKAMTCDYTVSGLSTDSGCNVKKSEYACADIDRVELTSFTCKGANGAKKSCGDVQVRGIGVDARVK